jgi:hypothetical protein
MTRPNRAKPDEARRRRVPADPRSKGRTEGSVEGVDLNARDAQVAADDLVHGPGRALSET